MLRDLVSTLSQPSRCWRGCSRRRALVRAATLAVVQIGDGNTPAAPLATLRPPSAAAIVGTATGKVDPATLRAMGQRGRAALMSVDPAEAAQVYVNVKPLFDEAYRELGHPSGDFDDAIVRAIRTLDATPERHRRSGAAARPGYFEHDDPALGSLPPVQKQLLLIGPAHRQRVLRWLHQLAAALELKID